MAYNLSNLLESAYRALGRTYSFVATGGSATTAICTNLKEKYQEGDIDDYTLFVSTTTDGLTPQGRYAAVSSYLESTNTITMATVTDVIAAGDVITLADTQFPLQEMIALANLALSSLGDMVFVDTSLTAASGQTEYDIPVTMKRCKPFKVQIQGVTDDSDNNQYKTISGSAYEIVPVTAGSVGKLIFRDEQEDGHTIKIWYAGVHPELTSYNSTVSEYIHPQLAQAALVFQALNWMNSQTAGSNDFWMQRQNAAQREFEIALQRFPIWKPKRSNALLDVGIYDS